MSKCLFPPSFLNPTNYERVYIFLRVDDDPLEQAYIESLKKRVADTLPDGIRLHLTHCDVRTGKSGKCNCKEASGDKQAREHTDAANSYTADTAVNPRPSTSTAEPAEDKVKLGCEKEKSSERKILTGGETEAHWNSYGDPRFFWIGPQAHIQLNDGPPAYFYPIADCYALSIAFYLPGFEFAILVDRRPAHSQLRKVPLLPGYRRMAELHFDGADFYLQDLLTWNSQRERIDLPEGTAPLIQQKRNEFLRRYWSDTL